MNHAVGRCRVVGTIWCVGVGNPSSRPIRIAKLGESPKVDSKR